MVFTIAIALGALLIILGAFGENNRLRAELERRCSVLAQLANDLRILEEYYTQEMEALKGLLAKKSAVPQRMDRVSMAILMINESAYVDGRKVYSPNALHTARELAQIKKR